MWADLLTTSFWGSQESDSGLLVFSGVKSQCVKLCVSYVAWLPEHLTASSHNVGSKTELDGAWEVGPTHSEEALRDKFKGAPSQIVMHF